MKNISNITKTLLVLVLGFGFLIPQTFAETQVKVNGVSKPVTTTMSARFCYDFNKNISGNGALDSEDIAALNKVLAAEGLVKLETKPVFSAEAVKNFQAKYASEVLHPVGLSTPSGFVGAATRAKLNKLYGCSNKMQTGSSEPKDILKPETPKVDGGYVIPEKNINTTEVKVIAPKVGDNWIVGKEYPIVLRYDEEKTDTKRMIVYLTRDYPAGSTKTGVNSAYAISMYTSDVKEIKFTPREHMIQSAGGYGDGYRIMVMICSGKQPCRVRGSSAKFSISPSSVTAVAPATPVAIDATRVKADVTGNGIVDALDALEISKSLGACAKRVKCLGDIDGNKIIDLADVTAIANAIENVTLTTTTTQ